MLFLIMDLEIEIGKILIDNKQTVSCAESCTGGNIAALLAKHSGSSAFFYGGVVAYQNEVKEKVLGVKKEAIDSSGAVSSIVVEQMAKGVRDLMGTDWAISTSGVAGPTGGSKEKPIGTVWFGWAGPSGVYSKKYQLGELRENNIQDSTRIALNGLLELIQ